MERKDAWNKYGDNAKKKVFSFAEDYREFISKCKTERECVKEAVVLARKAGFIDLNGAIAKKTKLKAGDKVYAVNKGKAIALFTIGKDSIEEGMNILGAHIDSPRLDIKQNPLYEDTGLAFFDTHYYGGIKKYQWVTLPMAIHGLVSLKNGKNVEITIGEDMSDPVVGVSDLLIHLASKQMEKKGSTVVEGEALNVLVGSMPIKKKADAKKADKANDGADSKDMAMREAVKAKVLAILKKKYNIEEEDFLSAELCVVPAGPARDYGIDQSMIMGYGHDDKVCAYPSLIAQLEVKAPKRTSVCILVDKEEIGSVGATGMHSKFFENTCAEVIALLGSYSDLALRRALSNSNMLSSDVSAAYDPNYPSVSEKNNSAYFGGGLVFNKYTGARGKSGSNDASAEYLAAVRKVMDDADVAFQTSELGKVDAGGGGTIAYILGNYGMNVVDSGVAVQNMHAPYEVISKVDLYEAYKGYVAFLKNAKKLD